MALQSLDIAKRSATTTESPQARKTLEVAKLIDVSKCIGCKACQVACMQWNDLRDEVGTCAGTYDNPRDMTDQSWTVMRYAEVETEERGLEWLIRKDGCMHCEDPGCLKACPAPGAIIKYANGIVDFHQENCIGCGYCVSGCPFNVPRISQKDSKAYKCTLCSDRVAVGLEPACVKVCPTGSISFGSKVDMQELAEERVTRAIDLHQHIGPACQRIDTPLPALGQQWPQGDCPAGGIEYLPVLPFFTAGPPCRQRHPSSLAGHRPIQCPQYLIEPALCLHLTLLLNHGPSSF